MYNVAFCSKPNTSQPGVRTYASYNSRDEFVAKMDGVLEHDDIVAAGFDDDRAEEINETHPFYYYYANLAQSFNVETGVFNIRHFHNMNVETSLMTGTQCPNCLEAEALRLMSGTVDGVLPIEAFFQQ